MYKGTTVCRYGRSSNVRSCDHQVKAKSVSIIFKSGKLITKVAKVSGIGAIGGDSGGPWSWSTTAWGIHCGGSKNNLFFTPVQQAEKKSGVTIKTK